MKIRIFLLTLLLISATVAGHCHEKIVTVATLEDYAPFCQKTGNSSPDGLFPPGSDAVGFEGYSWDVVRESFHAMGFSIQLSVAPWARSLKSTLSGNVDILFPTGKNTSRQKIFYYSEQPVNHSNFLIYVRKNYPITWNGLHSLSGLTIGMKRGFNYGDKWEAATHVIKMDTSTISQGFRMLDHHRIDGFVGYEVTWDYALEKNGWQEKYKKLPVFDYTNEYLVALKTNPRALELLQVFDNGKKILIQNGTMKEIENKWFGKK